MNIAAQVGDIVEKGAPYVAGGTFFGWLFGFLPGVAALFSIIFLGMQMVMNWEKFKSAFKQLFKGKGNSDKH
jgi:hypothetical protein